MAFPKNKLRRLFISDQEYHWCCSSQLTVDTPVGVEAVDGVLPPLDPKEDWYGYEWVYGFNSKTELWIQKEKQKIMLTIWGSYFFVNTLVAKEVKYLSITPKMVKKCIEKIEAEDLWDVKWPVFMATELLNLEVKAFLEE